MQLNVDKIYILHVKKGYEERAQFIEQQMQKFGLKFECVLDYDIPDISLELLAEYFTLDAPRVANAYESLIFKHLEALRRISANQYERAIVFEDDVILAPNFIEVVNAAMNEVASMIEPKVCYLGCANNMYTPRRNLQPGKYLYPNREVRAADSYLLGAREAKLILDWVEKYLAQGAKINLAMDHLYNKINRELGIQFLWLEPTVVKQGSMVGLFNSGLDHKRQKRSLVMNKIHFLVNQLRKKYLRF